MAIALELEATRRQNPHPPPNPKQETGLQYESDDAKYPAAAAPRTPTSMHRRVSLSGFALHNNIVPHMGSVRSPTHVYTSGHMH